MDEDLLNQYLTEVERNLKHMTKEEKQDIVAEIKSDILDTQLGQHEEMKQSLLHLGKPDELARGYQGRTIADTNKFSIGNFMRTIVFYGAMGIQEFILSVLAGALYISGLLTLLGGVLKTIGTLLGFDMTKVQFVAGVGEVDPLLALPIAIPFAILFYICSKLIWKNIRHHLKKSK